MREFHLHDYTNIRGPSKPKNKVSFPFGKSNNCLSFRIGKKFSFFTKIEGFSDLVMTMIRNDLIDDGFNVF